MSLWNIFKNQRFFTGNPKNCSPKSSTLNPLTQIKLKETNLEKYDFEYPSQNKESKEKIIKNCKITNLVKNNQLTTRKKKVNKNCLKK